MKERIRGRVSGDHYEIVHPGAEVISSTPLSDARKDTKLAAAIKRNGWEPIPEE